MRRSHLRRSAPFAVLAVVGLLAFPAPEGLLGQQAEEAAEEAEYTAEEIEGFARMYLEITEIRDQLHEDLARYHEEGRRREARERADARLAGVFEDHAVDAEDYEEFIRRIGLDQELRDLFEEAVERIQEEGG